MFNPQRSPEEHLKDVLRRVAPLETISAPTVDAAGLVLATNVEARLAIPPFSNSAMDGYLVNSADLPAIEAEEVTVEKLDAPITLAVSGEVAAGGRAQRPEPGTAVRIMTGAPVPSEFDGLTVVPVEYTDAAPGPGALPAEVAVHTVARRRNIRRLGDDITPADIVARAGTVIDAATQAALLSAGVPEVTVHRAPRVAVVSCGAELITFDGATPSAEVEHMTPGMLPDSNGPMLESLASGLAAATVTRESCDDDPERMRELLDRLAADHDLIVTSGGVSTGAYDVVHQVLSEQGDDVFFGEVSQKPGAPQGLGSWKGTPVIGLPGNPVAAFMGFQLYASAAIARLRGLSPDTDLTVRPHFEAMAGSEFHPAKNRTSFVPVHLHFGDAEAPTPVATPYHRSGFGSHRIGGMVGTRGYAMLEPTETVMPGDTLTIYDFPYRGMARKK